MNSDELRKKYPNAKHCNDPKCEFTERDHEACMAYAQNDYEMAKKGMIKTMYRMNYPEPDTKFFMFYDGKKWVELTQ